MRIILDTNLWISFLISRRYERLDSLLLEKKVKLIFSKELLEEFVEVTSEVKLCRDPKDNFLLSLAQDGKANYL